MTIWKNLFCAAMVAAAAIAQTEAAIAAPATANREIAAVKLPFAPPTGVDIRYRYEKRSEVRGQQQVLESQERLRFAPAADGYALAWTSDVLRVEAPGPMQAIMQRIYRDLSGKTMTIQVTAGGEVQAISDLATWRTLSDKAMTDLVGALDTEFASLPAAGRDMLRQMMQGMADQQRNQSDDQFTTQTLQSPRMLLRPGQPLRPGVPEFSQVEAPMLIGNGTIPMLLKTELADYQPGTSARVVVSSAADSKALQAFVRGLVSQFLGTITDPAARTKAEAEINQMPAPVMSEEIVQHISLPSGLPDRVEYRKSISIPGQPPRTEVQIFERLP